MEYEVRFNYINIITGRKFYSVYRKSDLIPGGCFVTDVTAQNIDDAAVAARSFVKMQAERRTFTVEDI